MGSFSGADISKLPMCAALPWRILSLQNGSGLKMGDILFLHGFMAEGPQKKRFSSGRYAEIVEKMCRHSAVLTFFLVLVYRIGAEAPGPSKKHEYFCNRNTRREKSFAA